MSAVCLQAGLAGLFEGLHALHRLEGLFLFYRFTTDFLNINERLWAERLFRLVPVVRRTPDPTSRIEDITILLEC